LKADIMDIGTGVLNKILQLKPVSYRYDALDSKQRTLGFIAQEVLPLFPELVGETSNKEGTAHYLSLNYGGFGPIAIKAIQEQQIQIEDLKKQNADLKALMEALDARIKSLEKSK
jgi:Chaperone of endosialidase